MNNTLTLTIRADSRVVTEFVTSDGVSTMEVHKEKENDEQVLIKLSNNKFYQRFKGDWTLYMDSKSFGGKEFTSVTSQGIAYINERDNPNTYMINFF